MQAFPSFGLQNGVVSYHWNYSECLAYYGPHSSPSRLVQDTHIIPLTKHDKTLARLVKLLSLQPQALIQISRAFSVPSIE